MHKSFLKALKQEQDSSKKTVINKKIYAKLVKNSFSKQPVIQPCKISYFVVGSIGSILQNKSLSNIEMLIDTGSQFSLSIPSFLAEYLNLYDNNPIGISKAVAFEGTEIDLPVYRVLLRINDLEFSVDAAIVKSGDGKVVLGAEFLSHFKLQFEGDQVVLSF